MVTHGVFEKLRWRLKMDMERNKKVAVWNPYRHGMSWKPFTNSQFWKTIKTIKRPPLLGTITYLAPTTGTFGVDDFPFTYPGGTM